MQQSSTMYIIIIGAVAKTLYYTMSTSNLTGIAWSHTCYNSGMVAIYLSNYMFMLVCGGNDGNKSAPLNNIYVLPSGNVASTSPYYNTPPVDAHCGNNITCSAAITIVNGSTTTQ